MEENRFIWAISDDGIAKISPEDEYPSQGRAGSGVIAMRLPASSLQLAAAAIGRENDSIVVLTSKNKAKYMRLTLAPQLKRGRAGGDFVISLRDNEEVTGVITYQSMITPAPENDEDSAG